MDANISEVLKALSAAIAPVFLLTGIGSLMSSANVRYGRTMDRIRLLLREGNKLYDLDVNSSYVGQELVDLVARARILRRSLLFMAVSMLMVAMTIFVVFGELLIGRTIAFLIEACFLTSIVALMLGMILFIQDYASSLLAIERDIQVRADPSTLDIIGQELS